MMASRKTTKNNDGGTALHSAARSGHEATVKLLLDRGANTATKNNDGGTALHSLAWSGHEATVKLLLDRGANTETKESDACTALHSSARNQGTGSLSVYSRYNEPPTIRYSRGGMRGFRYSRSNYLNVRTTYQL
jgi:ankyrin repeat protein